MADGRRLARAALLLPDRASPVAPGLVDHEVLALYEEATAAVGEEPSATRARLLSATAVELLWGPDSTRRIRLADEALTMARAVGDDATLTTVLAGNWAALDGRESLTDGWVELNEEWMAAAQSTGDPRDLHYALRSSIATFCCLGEVDAARRHLTTVDQLADRLRLPRFRSGNLFLHAMIDALAGDLDRAETEVMEAIAAGQGADVPEAMLMGSAGALLYAIRTAQGRVGELVPALADLVESQPGTPVWRVALGAALVRAGRLEEAQAPFDWLTADGGARIPQDFEFPVTLCALGRQGLDPGRGILAVEAGEDRVEVGLLVPERDRLVEEGLGGHGEELAGVGAAVAPEQTALPPPHRPVLGGADLDPPVEGGLVGQRRGAVDDAVEHVQLVGELVEHDVVAPLGVTGVPVHGVPGDDHRPAAVVGLADDRERARR